MEIIKYIQDFLSSYDNQEMVMLLIDAFVFLMFAICVIYLFIFAVNSVGKAKNEYPKARKKYRYAVIFPAYKEDRVITDSVEIFQEQDFPPENYDIFVASDHMEDATNKSLEDLGVKVVMIKGEDGDKTKTVKAVIQHIVGEKLQYDYVVILNADNTVDEHFLERLNDAFYSGSTAIQTHRVAKNYDTNIAYLDAVSEEINNSIFRKGHVKLGFSSGLLGSGMALDMGLFKRFIFQAKDIGIDKQLGMFLVKNNYYIDYMNDVYTYDEKVGNKEQFYKQRQRWVADQGKNFLNGLAGCPRAALDGNWDYCNKLFQWAMPPRVVLLGLITIIAAVLTVFLPMWSIKWWGLLLLLIIVFAMAIPDYLFNRRLFKAILNVPSLFLLMFLNTFTAVFGKKERHTEHFS